MVELNENALTVMQRRIARKDEKGNAIETPEEVFRRVARHLAKAEKKFNGDEKRAEDKFFRLMDSLDFLPNSPTLVNAGNELGQLSACFVLPVDDSISGIFDSVKNAAIIHKSGGGTGFSFSRLRPTKSPVDTTSGIASGPVSFMQIFDKATETIKQGGTRRGANMGILRVDHPDILDFITMKSDKVAMQNFNISVGITDAFMDAFKTNQHYGLVDPRTGKTVGHLSAKEVFDIIVENAHATGDPGLVFLDRINNGKSNPVPHRGPIEATNPCGEQPLYPYDSCNLGSINLSNFVSGNTVDYPRLTEVVHDAVHFLDNVVEMNNYPLREIEDVSRAIRRIGLGVMGWADMLIQLGIPYDSNEAIELAFSLSSFISEQADAASKSLGLARGSFPDKDRSIYKDWPYLRNSTRTTIAPTGTISIIAGCSSGIEPLFALAFIRSHYVDKDDPSKRYDMVEVNSKLVDMLQKAGKSTEFIEKLLTELASGISLASLVSDSEITSLFKTSHDIGWEWHIKHQAAWQTKVDNGVSKTINMSHDVSKEDVAQAYLAAYTLGCKGITVYRDGSKDNQVLRVDNAKSQNQQGLDISVDESAREPVVRGTRRKLPESRDSVTHHFRVGEQEGYIIVGLYEDGTPGEVFIVASKVGSTIRGMLDTIGTLLSYSLQCGAELENICSKLAGTRFEPSGFTSNKDIPVAASIVDYVFRWLRDTFLLTNDAVEEQTITEYTDLSGNLCPECDSMMHQGEGCELCQFCGYSKCG